MRYLFLGLIFLICSCNPSMEDNLKKIKAKYPGGEVESEYVSEKEFWSIYYMTQQITELEINIPESPPSHVSDDIYGTMVAIKHEEVDRDPIHVKYSTVSAYFLHKNGEIYTRDNFEGAISHLLK